MIGRPSSCAAVTAPWLAAAAMPMRLAAGSSTSATFRKVPAPVTTTSALSESIMTTSAVTDAPVVTPTGRRSTLKFSRRNVSSAFPGGTAIESVGSRLVRDRRQLA